MGLTIANQLTIVRMGMIPLLITLILSNHPAWALLVFILAGLTDALDGIIARRYEQSSELGAFLDPMADKLLMTALFIVLSIPDHPQSLPDFEAANHLPVYLAIVTISRDVFIVMISLVIHLATGHVGFKPTFLGKVTTVIQVVTVGTVLLCNSLDRPSPIIISGLVWLTLAMTLASGLHYIHHATRVAGSASRENRKAAKEGE
jgi:cardiolipin synthase